MSTNDNYIWTFGDEKKFIRDLVVWPTDRHGFRVHAFKSAQERLDGYLMRLEARYKRDAKDAAIDFLAEKMKTIEELRTYGERIILEERRKEGLD
jgi:hypothetical protein